MLAVVWIFTGIFVRASSISDEIQVQSELNRAIIQTELPGLVEKLRTEKIKFPSICSGWYLERIPQNEGPRLELEQLRREFGRSIAERLDGAAKTVTSGDAGEIQAKGQLLLDFEGKESDILLDQIWAKGVRSSRDWIRARRDNESKTGDDDPANWRRIMPEDLSFFCDDRRTSWKGHKTVLGMWNAKQHHVLVVGPYLQNSRNIDAFFLFREKVGYFPTKFTKRNPLFDDEVKAAFEYAWRPYGKGAPEAVRLAYSGAFTVFDQMRRGDFTDEDTRALESGK